MQKRHILVIDPGATNMRASLVRFKPGSDIRPQLDEVYKVPSGTKTVRGLVSETAPDRMFHLLRRIPADRRKNLAAIWTISHGATAIPLDGAGKPVFGGAVCYDQPAFGKHHDAFLSRFGGAEAIFMETGSPEYGSGINAAQQIFYYQQERPKQWERARTLIPLSHYLAFRLSGELATCHTHTRNHACFERIAGEGESWSWSSIVSKLGIQGMFPAFKSSFDAIGRVKKSIAEKYGLPRDCLVGSAGHDTSAVSILAPNYANTGTWICNTAIGVPVALVPYMQPLGLAVNADPFGRNLRTIMARLGVTRREYRAQFQGSLPEEMPFQGFHKVTAQLPVAFTDGVGVYHPVREARIPAGIAADELIHSISMMGAAAEALTAILTCNSRAPLSSKLSDFHQGQTPGAPDLVMGGVFVEPLEGGEMRTFADIFRRLYPGNVARFAFKEPTSVAAAVMAICALEGVDPRNLGDRLVLPKEDMTFTGDRRPAIEALLRWELENARLGG